MTLRDDLGRAVSLSRPARRVVSLAPSVTENLHAVGAGDRLVGATAACDFPTRVRRLPQVGNFLRPSYERIAALRPDLVVVASATLTLADAERLAGRLRIPVFVQIPRRYDDVARHLEQLGALTGRRDGAAAPARALARRRDDVARRVAGKPLVAVFVEVNPTPLYAVGPGSFVDDLIRLAGGRNVVTSGGAFPVVSKEVLLAADPQVYVALGYPGRPPRTFAPPLDRLRAVRDRRVVTLPADLLSRPTPRLADGLERLADALHPR